MRQAEDTQGQGDSGINLWWATFSGISALLVGIGLARFAYTPLIPALIEAGWFSASQAAYLGAANLAGYLAGALLARPMADRISTPLLLRAMMALTTVTLFACAAPLSFLWFFLWRFVSGLSGGVLMVLAAPAVLPHIPPRRQGIAGGAIFTGVGLGIAASGTLVPTVLSVGLVETWWALGALSLILTVAAWRGWPADGAVTLARAKQITPPPSGGPKPAGRVLKALYVEYGLNAVGLVPHMVFLVDFIARGLGAGLGAGAWYWVLFGVGAVFGPSLAGSVADRIGFRLALRLAFIVQAAGIGWIAVAPNAAALTVSSLIVGAFVPGIVALVLGRVRELRPGDPDGQRASWSLATTAFAIGQAAAAYAFSYIFDRAGSYVPVFELGAAALILALVIDVALAGSRPNRAGVHKPH